MKNLTALFTAAVLIWIALCGFTPVSPSSDLYVTDNADILSNDTENHIVSMSNALKEACGAEIAVLTVKNLDGMEISDYSYRTADKWGLGDKEKDNGLLIVLATSEREVWVSTGTGLEGRLNDAKVGRLIDNNALDYFKNNDYDKGISELYDALLSEVMAEYEIEELDGFKAEPENDGFSGLIEIIIVIVVLLLISGRFWFIPLLTGGRRGGGKGNSGGFGGFGGFGGGSSGGGSFGGGGFSGGGAGRGF